MISIFGKLFLFYLFTVEKPEIQNHFWTQRKNKILKIRTVFINKNSKYIFCKLKLFVFLNVFQMEIKGMFVFVFSCKTAKISRAV